MRYEFVDPSQNLVVSPPTFQNLFQDGQNPLQVHQNSRRDGFLGFLFKARLDRNVT